MTLEDFRALWRAFFGERPTVVEDVRLLGFPLELMSFSHCSGTQEWKATYQGHVGRGETRLEAARAAMKSWRGGES